MLMQGRLRFGEVARRMGVLEGDDLRAALHDQVREKLARCLHWERSQHVFVPQDHGYKLSDDSILQIEPVLFAGVTRHYALERVRDVISPFWHDDIELRGDIDDLVKYFELDAEDRLVLASLDGTCSMRQLLAESGARRERCGHLLVALALTDQLELPEAVAPEESGPFIIEDLPRSARRESHTGPVPRPPAVRPPLREVSHLPGKEKLLADSAFLQGKELLRASEYGAAADAFREASNLRPSALEYALFAAWSAYLSTGRAVKWRDMLVELCERTLAQDRHLAFAYHVRGQLALETKDSATAREALRRAVELDPQDDEARRLLARLSN
jgi:tetratricopeptide (TPR) repeat protein